VPIIMITSRTGDKHRDRAFEIGVNDYLGKPYQESELLESINNIIGVKTRAVGA
jgi:chemosensory pili system protein ChpA (sensor histidine kinase/response regulator)